MAKLIEIEPNRTYATKQNAVIAVEKLISNESRRDLTYFIMPTSEGRFFPVFIGERAVQAGMHRHFNVVG